MIQQWGQEKRDTLWSEIQGNLSEPHLVDVHRTGVSGPGDVRSSYRPHGVDRVGGGGPGGDPSAAARIIDDGRAKLGDDRASAEASRTNRAGATVDLQSEVAKDQNRGFFTDPDLRK